MKKFVVGFIIGILFAGLLVVILAFAAMRYGDRPPTVNANSTLVLHLEGDLPEQLPVEVPLPFLQQQQPMAMVEMWQVLRKAAADTRIKALVVEPRDLEVGWAKLQELRADIAEFKKSGKPVYAYLRGAGTREYYVATAADRIFMSQEDELDLKGMRVELMFLKGGLDKLGVEMEFEHEGKYKDAPDMFTRTSSTPETREVMNQVLDQLYGNLIDVIAQSRKKPSTDVRALIDQGPFVGKSTIDGGLVDALLFEDQMYDELKQRLKETDINRIGERDYARVPASSLGLEGPNRIALVVGEGDITRGASSDGIMDTGITAGGLVKVLRQVENDSSIKGVIFRIDSPGGDGIASDDILHEAKVLSQKKPVVISMSDVAASGGYDMAMTGDTIVAYPQTETGSIGVVFGKPNLHGLYEKLGITKDAVERGKHADVESDYTPLTPEEREMLRRGIDESYRNFVNRVASARHRTFDQIEPLAQGRVWLGDQAKDRGLVDQLGGLDTAIDLVKQKARIPAAEGVSLVMYPSRRSIVDVLLRRSTDDPLETRLAQVFGRLPFHAWMKGGMLRVMPYWVTVQ